MKIGFKTALGAIIIAATMGFGTTTTSAMPLAGVQSSARVATPKAEQVYYRCGYYGCRNRYYSRRYYNGAPYYNRGYYNPGYYRPGIGLGIGGLGIGIY